MSKSDKLGLQIINLQSETEGCSDSQFFIKEKKFYRPDVIVIRADGIIFDVQNSLIDSIKQTYKYFTGKSLADKILLETLNLDFLCNHYQILHYLIEQYGFNFAMHDVESKFNEIYWNDSCGLINNETLIVNTESLVKINRHCKLILLSDTLDVQLQYRLHKFHLTQYFNFISSTNLNSNQNAISLLKEKFNTEKIWLVSNSINDMKLSVSENIWCVAINSFDDSSKMLFNNGADELYSDINEMLKKYC